MKHIGIIGAGISGLATAKAFIEKGYRVTVFEKAANVGGVWERSRSYVGVATQTTRDEYAFSDYPMPGGYPLWPSGEQVQAYLEGYAKQFNVFQNIWFNVQVNTLCYRDKAWHMELTDLKTKEGKYLRFDFVAVCTGTFHKPFIPSVEGSESFMQAGGEILHSSQAKDAGMLKDKKVAVVGFAKSATDIATTAANFSKECILLYRKAQWKV
ncbi:MAG: NAD(P)/FAD-dependent oxidoreductase, partial [Chitinophagaceae bacterium]|nr:NAD(P)/FAD-dependent oxidoreductase [Chitinophagaceae bacterium]